MACYIYDVRDMNARVGNSDYVFVANVVKKGAATETPEDEQQKEESQREDTRNSLF